MSCLLPQFKTPPEFLPLLTKSHHHSIATNLQSKCMERVQANCILSTSSATLFDVENLSLPTLIDCSHSDSAHRPQNYVRDTDTDLTLGSSGATFASEAYFTSDGAVIAAAAAEAVALARAAAEVAKDAALMVGKYNSVKLESDPSAISPSDSASILLKRVQLINETEHANSFEDSIPLETRIDPNHSAGNFLEEGNEREMTIEEIKQLQDEFSWSAAVRSNRRNQKKNRKIKITEKVPPLYGKSSKSVSMNRKKRAAAPEVVYSDPLCYLRGTTGTAKLLRANEEMVLSTGIQELLKLERLRGELVERYGSQPSFRQWAAAAGVDQRTMRSRINYGILCKEKMIKSNIRLVISIAKNYQGAGMNIQDLVQEGCRGLVRGTEKFDASKGFKFSTYAHWWIKQAIKKSLSDLSRTIRLPFHIVEATYRVKEARRELYSENGSHPTNEEVALATGLSMKRLMSVLQAPKPPKSLDKKIGMNLDLKPSEIISDPEAETAEEVLIKQFMKQDLDKVLNTLTPREKQVLRWRFGIPDGRMKTLQEIGELMEVSRERIRQIETCAFQKLKNRERIQLLQQYIHS